jgi:hypothetical protein
MRYASQINLYKHTKIRTSLKVGSNVRWLLLLPIDASLLLSPVACSGTTTIAITMNNTAARLVIIFVGCAAEVELYFWRAAVTTEEWMRWAAERNASLGIQAAQL